MNINTHAMLSKSRKGASKVAPIFASQVRKKNSRSITLTEVR